MADFAGLNLTNFFNSVWAPGAAPFYRALQFYQRQLNENAVGKGAAQLAAGQAGDQPAADYAAGGASAAGGPTQGAAQSTATGAFANLGSGLAKSRLTGQNTQSQVRKSDIGGALDTSSAFGGSLVDYIKSQIALNNAKSSQQSGIFGDIMNGLKIAGGIGSEIIAPGNPFGIAAIAGGAGGFSGGGGGSPFGSIFGGSIDPTAGGLLPIQ